MKCEDRIHRGIVVAIFILGIFSCRESPVSGRSTFAPSVIFSTSLADTLPSTAYLSLNAGNVVGIKFKDLNGKEVRYFDYQCAKKRLLKVVSQMSFSVDASISDTLCRKISVHDVMNYAVPESERIAAEEFWNISQDVEIYECIKGRLKHTLILTQGSERVLHRIEYLH